MTDWSAEVIADVHRRHDAGETYGTIERETGVPISTARAWITGDRRSMNGRARVYERRQATNVRLPEELLVALGEAASERQVGRNWLITRLLEEGLKNMRPLSDFKLIRRET